MNNSQLDKNNQSFFIQVLLFIVFYTAIFSAFINTSLISIGLAILMLCLFIQKLKLSIIELFLILTLLGYITITLILSDNTIVPLKNFRFWYGIILYLILFKIFDPQRFINMNFVRLLFAMIIAEAILINLIIDPSLIYSGPGSENYAFYGFYYRPMSFAGNASLSVSALIVLFASVDALNRSKMYLFDWLILILCVCLLHSGIGFVLITIFLIYKALSINMIKAYYVFYFIFSVFIISILIYLYVILTVSLDNIIYQKISPNYFSRLFTSKIELYYSHFVEASFMNILLGNQINSLSPNTTGDFGWLILIQTLGVFGFILYLGIIISYLGKNNKQFIPIILLMIATFHYPAAMTAAGQVILATLLIHKKNNIYEKY